MKRHISFLLIAMLLLSTTACKSSKENKEVTETPAALAEKLAAETITTDPLNSIAPEILASTYFVDMEQIEDSSALLSNGATSCEITVIKCKENTYTSEVKKLFETRVKNQADLYITYNAAEAKRLDSAIIKISGNYVVLCVCDDNSKAESILTEAGF